MWTSFICGLINIKVVYFPFCIYIPLVIDVSEQTYIFCSLCNIKINDQKQHLQNKCLYEKMVKQMESSAFACLLWVQRSDFREWTVRSVCIPLLDVKRCFLALVGSLPSTTHSYLCVLEISSDLLLPVLVQSLLKHSLITYNCAWTQNNVTKEICLNLTQSQNMAIFIFPKKNYDCWA